MSKKERERERARKIKAEEDGEREREREVCVPVAATESGDNWPPSRPTSALERERNIYIHTHREGYQKSLIVIPSRFPVSCARGTRNFIVSGLIRGRARAPFRT